MTTPEHPAWQDLRDDLRAQAHADGCPTCARRVAQARLAPHSCIAPALGAASTLRLGGHERSDDTMSASILRHRRECPSCAVHAAAFVHFITAVTPAKTAPSADRNALRNAARRMMRETQGF